jgi:DNA helicase II / ATP-dependent DNA helicase PcrA
MPSINRIIICAAGGGKTTTIVREACEESGSRCALITYTRNNEQEISRKFYNIGPALPPHVEVMSWFTFLLRELARPYRAFLHTRRIEGLSWQEGRSVPFIPQSKTSPHYFHNGKLIYSDKIAKFACECDRLSGGMVMRRLSERFDHIFIDEVQDLAGYDLEILELIFKAGIRLSLVGDHRQAIIRTNNAKLNAKFVGSKIIDKFREWDKRGLATLSYQLHTHRCHQQIASLGDSLFPGEPPTKSLSDLITGHDGVFIVPPKLVSAYIERFVPQILRLDKKTTCDNYPAMNFGESKGLTFDRVLIFPHGGGKKWLSTGKLVHVEKSAAKMYVGTTRARYSVAFVFEGPSAIPYAQPYL